MLSALFYGCSSTNLTTNFSVVENEAHQILSLGDRFLFRGDLSSALNTYKEAFEKFSSIDETNGKVIASLKISGVYNQLSAYEEADEWFSSAELNSNDDHQSLLLLTKCELFFERNLYEEIIQLQKEFIPTNLGAEIEPQIKSYLLLSKQLTGEDISKDRALLIELLNSQSLTQFMEIRAFLAFTIGKSFLFEEDNLNADRYLMQALELDKTTANTPAIAITLELIGDNKAAQNNFYEAKEYYNRSLDSFTSAKLLEDIAHLKNKLKDLTNN